MVLRGFADALAVQMALVMAYLGRLFIVSLTHQEAALSPLAEIFATSYMRSCLLLVGVLIPLFALSGFYTAGHVYRKFRLPWIALMVAAGWAMFAGLAFLNNNWFQIPRGVVPLGWLFTTLVVAGMRVASSTWASVLKAEGRLLGRPRLKDIRVNSVLVIGGAGYIGSALVPRLLARGYNVRVLDLLLWGTEPIKDYVAHPHLEVVEADLRQIDKIVEAMRGMDAVVHLGGIVGDPACSLDEGLTIDVNLAATRLIAEVARGEGVQRLLFASTCSVYGSGDALLSESSVTNPLSLYAKTKLASERVLLDIADHEFAPVVFRFGTIFGFSGRTRFDLVVNLLTAKAIQEGKITVFGGNQWRPFVHVDDAARAVFMLLEAPLDKVRGEVFNVGSEAGNRTISQVADVVKSVVPDAEIVNMGGDTDKRDYRGDFRKIRRVIGFEAEWSVEDGVRQIEEVLRAGTIPDYKEARYSNVRFLSEATDDSIAQPDTGWPVSLLEEQEAVLGGLGSWSDVHHITRKKAPDKK